MKTLAANVVIVLTMCNVVVAAIWPAGVGIYDWGGSPQRTMAEGVKAIAALGGTAARVTLSPRYYAEYGSGSSCYPEFSLKAIAADPDVKAALDNPNIAVFMLTAYDGVTFGDCMDHSYLNPHFYTPQNTAALIQEYSDFTLYLYETYRHTHKRFIISNWESDNDVYCGDAYRYATDKTVRDACNTGYPSMYQGNASPDQSFKALTKWFAAREQGIADGRNRAAAKGLGGMRVLLAPEFSSVHMLHDAGFKSVLYDVAPQVIFDYVSYSSYESINHADSAAALIADLQTIQDVVGSSSIILGEVGFARSIWGPDTAASRTQDVVSAAMAWGVSLIFIWNLYDQDSQSNFGLVDGAGALTPLGLEYKNQRGMPKLVQ